MYSTGSIDLSGKVAVVTGGGGVIGSVFCMALAGSGASVAVLDRDRDQAKKIADALTSAGGKALAVQADVLSRISLFESKKIIEVAWGPCDILINAAGGNHPKGTTTREYFEPGDGEGGEDMITFFDLETSGIEHVFNLNFMGTFLPVQVFAREMAGRPGATIINISSMNAFKPLTKIPAYSAAKAAVSNFTQWLAVHFARAGIRVNAIAPGFFLTEQNRSLLTRHDGSFTERAEKILAHTPLCRFGTPEELVGTLLWLVDEKSSGFVNGVVVPVDGGFSAYAGV